MAGRVGGHLNIVGFVRSRNGQLHRGIGDAHSVLVEVGGNIQPLRTSEQDRSIQFSTCEIGVSHVDHGAQGRIVS